ncbi:MAG: hypothetical protein QM679_02700, partial [Patulibacter sp.]
PLHASRLASRGAPAVAARALADRLTFYDTSSYDAAVQRAVTEAVGEAQIVHGSDRPTVASVLPAAIAPDRLATNARALLGRAA